MDPSDAQLRWAFLVGEANLELDENVDCLRPAEVAASRVCGSTGT